MPFGVTMIHPILLLMPLVNCQKVVYNGLNLTKNSEEEKMKDYKVEFMKVIDESEEPEKVALYVLNLFLDYLGKSSPSQETHAAVPPVSDR
jgi:hypothetical protein